MPLYFKIVPHGTCLVRGKSRNDTRSKKRFFAYYGEKKDIALFMNAKKFVTQYAHMGEYQYFHVDKNLLLLDVPYLHVEFSKKKAFRAIKLAFRLMKYVHLMLQNHHEWYGCIYDAIGIEYLDEGTDYGHNANIYIDSINAFMKTVTQEHNSCLNPDYKFANLICNIGLHGWCRKSSDKKTNSSDEVFLCNIDILQEQGYLSENSECNLVCDDL